MKITSIVLNLDNGGRIDIYNGLAKIDYVPLGESSSLILPAQIIKIVSLLCEAIQ